MFAVPVFSAFFRSFEDACSIDMSGPQQPLAAPGLTPVGVAVQEDWVQQEWSALAVSSLQQLTRFLTTYRAS